MKSLITGDAIVMKRNIKSILKQLGYNVYS